MGVVDHDGQLVAKNLITAADHYILRSICGRLRALKSIHNWRAFRQPQRESQCALFVVQSARLTIAHTTGLCIRIGQFPPRTTTGKDAARRAQRFECCRITLRRLALSSAVAIPVEAERFEGLQHGRFGAVDDARCVEIFAA